MTADLPDEVKQAVPARRAGRPEDVAACVAFLASEKAGYVTGTTLYVDGGLAA
jgi:3-oxoacyl-[acyl-carrier protein] reductase